MKLKFFFATKFFFQSISSYQYYFFIISISYKLGSQLNQQLENWLDKAELTYGPARAIIAPYV